MRSPASVLLISLHAIPAKRQGASADKLQLKAARILPLFGLAKSKPDPVHRKPPVSQLLYDLHSPRVQTAFTRPLGKACQELAVLLHHPFCWVRHVMSPVGTQV